MAETKKGKKLTREDILEQALDDIRSKFGDGSIMRLGERNTANVEVIPTGILPLDVALGIGGLPRGRIVEIFGPEGSGKTTLALHAIAEAQKAGGVAAFIDAEHALDPRLAAALGVQIESLYLSQPDSGEQALFILETLVRSGAVDIVVVDSVAALTPQAEIDGTIGESQVGLQARLMSYGLRRLTASIARSNCVVVFINQLRATIPTGYSKGPTETTTGGRALKFYTSVRIEVRRGKQISKGDDVIGHELYIKVVKNKQAPPFRSAHCSLIYGKGIPLTMSIVDMAIDANVVKRKGSWLTYKGETLAQGKDRLAEFLDKNPEMLAEIRKTVLDQAAEGLGFYTAPEKSDDEDSVDSGHGVDIDEEVIDLDISDESMQAEAEKESKK
ncbi:recombinase RecA [Pyramidobacter sp. YE332]|uniref:recombinase RecA n=1 Tax=unclassified Pyramidobacter TaxID=2632171 RepID=UPI00098F2C1F|nr:MULTISPECIES: recombinase RecA [unclassified Pyramidobacter]OON89840.1 recombinase RecA [Pyramidobacter sp. C12-8]WOL40249.1 recombinase RecA [Pyramidobacter sp. YE332]